MQLTDHDTFGTVDDEGPLLGHDRQLTEEHGLFDNILHRLVRTLLVARHQA